MYTFLTILALASIFISAALIAYGVRLIEKNEGIRAKVDKLIMASIITIFISSVILGVIGATKDKPTYKDGQIDALTGKQKYKVEILYKSTEDGIIPVDTNYVLK